MVEAIVSAGMLMWMTGDVDNGTFGLAAAAHMRSQRYSSLGEAAESPRLPRISGVSGGRLISRSCRVGVLWLFMARCRPSKNPPHTYSVCRNPTWTFPSVSSGFRTSTVTCASRRSLAAAFALTFLRRPSRPAALALLVLLHHQHHLPSLVTNHTSTDVYVCPG